VAAFAGMGIEPGDQNPGSGNPEFQNQFRVEDTQTGFEVFLREGGSNVL
jgi:hypothetical protein